MKFKSVALPAHTLGVSFVGVEKLTVPDQSMSLREILERFVRNEPLPLGNSDKTYYDDSGEDLEKLAHADLVDQDAFIARQKDLQNRFKQQEKAREVRERAEIRAKLEAEEAEKLKKPPAEGPAKLVP